jgi:uncharacterized protein (TIGR02421 family)
VNIVDPGARREKLVELDRLLVKTSAGIRVLGAVSFPANADDDFLSAWRRGEKKLPDPPRVKPVPHAAVDALEHVCRAVDRGDPLGRFVFDTAASYRKAAAMLDVAGTPEFHALSREVYGGPAEPLIGTHASHVEAADRLLDSTHALSDATREAEEDYCLTPTFVAAEIRRRLDAFFADDPVEVVLDEGLAAKAAASATRVRLRTRTSFSRADVMQLVEHEAFVHSATALNGRKQPVLASLSLGAPRTTATQEGLATFAELITGAIDLARLRRLALRIRAVHLAEEGADFLEVFQYLLEAGQTESESVSSALRIFRGGDVRGRYPFTKDVVYLRGLIAVHTFLRRAIADVRPELVGRLFVGRLTVGDALALEEPCAAGDVVPARYVPAWADNIRGLAAYLSFSAVLNEIRMRTVTLAELAAEHGEHAPESIPRE